LNTLRAIRLSRSPIIAVHDYQRQNCPGVGRAVESCKASGFEVIERVDSLIVLRRREHHTAEPKLPLGE
jgi:hypothetical protein